MTMIGTQFRLNKVKPLRESDVIIAKMDAYNTTTTKSYVGEVRYLSRLVEKPTMWFPNRSDTNRPVQLQKQARSLKYWS